ncbi:OLC1v1020511C1 [Oldenlandia corymbosa var. corymbosa]|uniref:OLC1v1020511C1 n=1 Tax=Oldenlandia corymbosa var. corymbosa TaxID=529605 RepID=A0AAV1EGS1_OLDCO|nr:OLC1v1020511C1 [Oldenlandia corymbosa var. corymbosa]
MAKIHPSLRVLMFPWLGHGHISPYLELAKKLFAKNFMVYLCSTPANLTSVRSKLSEEEEFNESIKLVELEFESLPELPPNYHTTNGLPPHLMPTLKEAFDCSVPEFLDILTDLNPELLIYDILQPWSAVAASVSGIPAVEFITGSVAMTALGYHSLVSPPGTEFPFESIFFRDYESALREKLFVHDKDSQSFTQCIECSKKMILVKSIAEVEGKYIDYFSSLTGKKVIPVGHLVQEPNFNDYVDKDCESWIFLTRKKRVQPSLFLLGVSTFCVTKICWKSLMGNETSLEEVLPKDFLIRVGDRGKVVNGWAPQAKILTHPNTGGFASHCGWNSVLEGMKFGLPIIAMPMHLDQPVNARLIEEHGVGIEVLRDSSGNLQRETIANVIDKVVKGIDGEKVREKAKEMSKKIQNKGEEEIDNVVEELVQLCFEKDYY